jgi:hypothetical protein
MQRSKLLALSFLAGALLIGGALGFTADRMIGSEKACVRADRQAMRERMAADLNLTPVQRQAFDSLLEKRHSDMDAVMSTVRPQLDSIRQETRQQMARMLDDQQRARYEKMLEEAKAEQARREAGAR